MATTVHGAVRVEGGLVRQVGVTVEYKGGHKPGICVVDSRAATAVPFDEAKGSLERIRPALEASDFVNPGLRGNYLVSFSLPDRPRAVTDATTIDLAIAVALLMESGQSIAEEDAVAGGLFAGRLDPNGDVVPFGEPRDELALTNVALHAPGGPLAVIDSFPVESGRAITSLRYCGPGGDEFDELVSRAFSSMALRSTLLRQFFSRSQGAEGPEPETHVRQGEYAFTLPADVISYALESHGFEATDEAVSALADDLGQSYLDEVLEERAANFVNDYVSEFGPEDVKALGLAVAKAPEAEAAKPVTAAELIGQANAAARPDGGERRAGEMTRRMARHR